MRYRITVGLLMSISSWISSFAQDYLNNSIVLIESGNNSGLGYIIGEEAGSLYYVTLSHLVESNSAEIQFFQFQDEWLKAEVIHTSPVKNLAVLKSKKPVDLELTEGFKFKQVFPKVGESNLKVVGRNGMENRWVTSLNHYLLQYSPKPELESFSINVGAIRAGFAGGAVLNQKNELLGLVHSVFKYKANAISFRSILSFLDSVNVPANLIVQEALSPVNGTNKYYDGFEVILIHAKNDHKEERGAGLIVGIKESTAYVITAKHVIKNKKNLIVRLRNGKEAVLELLAADIRKGLDVAILKFRWDQDLISISSLEPRIKDLLFREEVTVIGHPVGNEWDINVSNKIKEVQIEKNPYNFSISPEYINSGNSGGPIFDKKGKLIGMITKVNRVKALGIRISEIQQIFLSNKLPMNVID